MNASLEQLADTVREAKTLTWRAQERLVIAGLLANDLASLTLAFTLAYLFRFANPRLPYYSTFSGQFYVTLMLWCVPLYMLIFAVHRLYDPHTLFGGMGEYVNVASSCTFGVVVLVFYGFLMRDGEVTISRGWLIAAWFLTIVLAAGARFIYRRVVYSLRRKGYLLAKAVIVGTNEDAQAVASQLQGHRTGGLQVIGFLADRSDVGSTVVDELQVLGRDVDLARLITELGVHEVIVAPTAVGRERLLNLHHALSGFPDVHLRLSSGLFEIVTTGVEVHDVGNVPLISLNRLRITGLDALLKYLMDYGLTIPGVVVISPLLLALAIMVKRSSPGPIIHRRRVMGRGGTQFDAYKFRTMVENADDVLAAMLEKNPELKAEYESGQKLKDDPRVTPLGHKLRLYSLDELPQVFNVLKGQMSLVGPRMIAPTELKMYGAWAHNLLTVKPGMTGPWQVMGRNDLPYPERVRLSMNYIRNYSIWTDLKILFFDTLMIVVKGRGAY